MSIIPRNITIATFEPFHESDSAVVDSIARRPIRAPGPMELQTIGFGQIIQQEDGMFSRRSGDWLVCAVHTQSKSVPASAVKKLVAERIKKLVERGDGPVNSKARKKIKEDVIMEMLSVAFVTESSVPLWINLKGGLLLADTASKKAAENAISMFRLAVHEHAGLSLGIANAMPKHDMETLMTSWLKNRRADRPFALGNECQMLIPGEKAKWSGRSVDLCGAEVQEHIRAGLLASRVGLAFASHCTFVIDDRMVIRSLKFDKDLFLDIQAEDQVSEFDACALIVGSHLRDLLSALKPMIADNDDPGAGGGIDLGERVGDSSLNDVNAF